MVLALHILRTSSALESAARRAFRRYGISPAQFNVLNIVSDYGAGVSSIVVADQLLVDRSNITGLVKGLVKAGLLEVEPSASDRRVKLLRLSRKGRTLWTKLNEVYQSGLAEITKAIGPNHKVVLTGLEKMEAAANELFR